MPLRGLKEYSIFVDTVRIQCKETNDLKAAVTKAVDICIEKGILRDVLVKYKEGIEEGLSLGRIQMAQEIALRLFQSGNSPEQIAQLTGIDIQTIKLWIEEAK